MNVRFDHPEFLVLGLLAIPLVIVGWRALALTDPLRRAVALMLRTALLLALALLLAGPHMIREHDQLTVIGLLDISGSVRRFADLSLAPDDTDLGANGDLNSRSPTVNRHYIASMREWFRRATQPKEPDDRFGLVVFDGKAIAISAPTRGK